MVVGLEGVPVAGEETRRQAPAAAQLGAAAGAGRVRLAGPVRAEQLRVRRIGAAGEGDEPEGGRDEREPPEGAPGPWTGRDARGTEEGWDV